MNRITRNLVRLSLPFTTLAFFAVPALAFAQSPASALCKGSNNLCVLLQGVVGFIDVIIVPLVFALAFITFVWGIYNTFIAGATNEEKRSEGQKLVIYGLIGFFLMFSIWGLVNLLLGTFGFGGQTRPGLPTFNGGGSAPSAQSASNPFGNSSQGTCNQDSDCPPGETCELISGTGICSGPHTTGSTPTPSPTAGGASGNNGPTPPSPDAPVYH